MEVFRITKTKYKNDLSGKGAELFGGRWNEVGTPALYTSENRALCALEILVHTPKDFLPPKYIIQSILIPKPLEKELVNFTSENLPDNWNSIQHLEVTVDLGEENFKKNVLGLLVPSVIIKSEKNIVLNPLHRKYDQIRVVDEIDFVIDERLLKK